MTFIATLAGILFATQLVAHVFNRVGIPDVIGQIMVGVIAGPAILDWIKPGPMINEFQEIGVIVLMFIAGLESDLSLLKKYLRPALVVAFGGMLVPIVVMGGASALFGLRWFEALFIGVIFSATSVSISVAVLRDYHRLQTREGATILGAAVADDIGGVMLLSILISLMNGSGGGHQTSLSQIILWQVGFFGGTYLLVRWLAPYLMHLSERLLTIAAPAVMAMALCLAMAAVADRVHLSGAVGSFFAGIAVANTRDRAKVAQAFEPLGYAVFIPVFFVNVGLAIRLDHLGAAWPFMVVMTLLACLTKLVGAGGGAYLTGFNWSSANVIGSGMVSRGEMALITAQIGYGAQLLSPAVYADIITVIVLATVLAPFMLKDTLHRQARHGTAEN